MQVDIIRQYSCEKRKQVEETGIFEAFDEAAFKKERDNTKHKVQQSRRSVLQYESQIRNFLKGLHEELTPSNSQIPPDILQELYAIKDSPERQSKRLEWKLWDDGPNSSGETPHGIVSGPSSSRPHFRSAQYPMLKYERFSSRIVDFETGGVAGDGAGAETGDEGDDDEEADVEMRLDEDDVDDEFEAAFEAEEEAEEEAEVVSLHDSDSDTDVNELAPKPKPQPQSQTRTRQKQPVPSPAPVSVPVPRPQPYVSISVPIETVETPLKRRGRGRPPGSKTKNKRVKTDSPAPHTVSGPVPAAARTLSPPPRPSPSVPAPPETTPKRRGPGRPPLSHKKTSSPAFRPAPASASASATKPSSSSSTPFSQPRMVVQLEIQPAARCRRCNQPYPSGTGCQNQDCEVGIRLVLDSLRSSPLDEATRQATRKRLVAKLKAITKLKGG